ncbi:unnamed protein product [Schistocephalus solidus]|uniref:Reverse transcriptase domain-containing protein n=1 Tax=Schistocephalus solidus TaxID=70667 RepID=A0A3P7BJV3_SCHSO|nr:unnamed protein product [Schistocephalus solidus]
MSTALTANDPEELDFARRLKRHASILSITSLGGLGALCRGGSRVFVLLSEIILRLPDEGAYVDWSSAVPSLRGRAAKHSRSPETGVKQGCVLASTLFSLRFSDMLMDAYLEEQPGIRIAYRTDGHLLNSRRMQAQRACLRLRSMICSSKTTAPLTPPGIRIAYRTDGHLLNSRRMQASNIYGYSS